MSSHTFYLPTSPKFQILMFWWKQNLWSIKCPFRPPLIIYKCSSGSRGQNKTPAKRSVYWEISFVWCDLIMFLLGNDNWLVITARVAKKPPSHAGLSPDHHHCSCCTAVSNESPVSTFETGSRISVFQSRVRDGIENFFLPVSRFETRSRFSFFQSQFFSKSWVSRLSGIFVL